MESECDSTQTTSEIKVDKETTDATVPRIANHADGHLPPAPEKEIKNRVFILKPGFAYNPWTKWPRNLACVCGSGLKFKNCHAGNLSHAIPAKDEMKAKMEFERMALFVERLKSQGITYKRDMTPPKPPTPELTNEPARQLAAKSPYDKQHDG